MTDRGRGMPTGGDGRPADGMPARIRGVLFDLDGTLYLQRALRCFMALELMARPLATGVRAAAADARSLAIFRRDRERLREVANLDESLETAQFTRAAADAGCDAMKLQALVEEWIYRRPLKYLRACRRPGIAGLLDELQRRRVRLGVLSDYPAQAKLAALRLTPYFDTVLCTTDAEINAFKPHARGFERALEIWRLRASEVLYVGDRADVDEAGAARAGMSCWILRLPFRTVGRLRDALCRHC